MAYIVMAYIGMAYVGLVPDRRRRRHRPRVEQQRDNRRVDRAVLLPCGADLRVATSGRADGEHRGARLNRRVSSTRVLGVRRRRAPRLFFLKERGIAPFFSHAARTCTRR